MKLRERIEELKMTYKNKEENSCMDCKHFRYIHGGDNQCNFYKDSIDNCKIKYCGIFVSRRNRKKEETV